MDKGNCKIFNITIHQGDPNKKNHNRILAHIHKDDYSQKKVKYACENWNP